MKSCENLCQAGNSPLPWLTMAAMASPSVHPLPPSRPLESAPGDGVHHRPQTWHWKSNRFYTVDHLWNMFFFHCHVWIPEGKEFHRLFNTHMVPKLKRSNTELGVLGEYWLQGMGFVCIKYDYLFNKWNCSFHIHPSQILYVSTNQGWHISWSFPLKQMHGQYHKWAKSVASLAWSLTHGNVHETWSLRTITCTYTHKLL